MFSAIFRSQDAGLLPTQTAIEANAPDLSIPTFNLASVNANIQSASSTSESTTTVNGKTTSIRVTDNLIQVKTDFTSDGVNDLVQINRADGVAQLFVNQSEPIGTPIILPVVPPSWDFSGLTDGDGNGVPDLYWTDKATGQSTVWLSTGSTTPPFYYRTEPTGSPGVTMPVEQLGGSLSRSRPDIQSRIQAIFGRIFQ